MPPRRPADRPTPGAGRPAAGRPAAATGSTPTPGEPGRRQTARKAQPVRYSPVKIEERRWGRHALVGVVVLAVIIGAVGWYRYLTRPPRAVEIATSPVPPGSTAETPPSPEPASATSAATAPARPAASGPLTVSAKELEDTLRAGDPQSRPSLGDYTGREVVWAGTVVSAGSVNELRRVELKDPDGVRIVAWCDAGGEISAGADVTIRGYLASKIASGFVVERCTVL